MAFSKLELEQYRFDSAEDFIKSNVIYDTDEKCYKKTIFSGKNVKKIGIQGTPNWKFSLNDINNSSNKIMIGYTGIFEMDISETSGDINNMTFYWPIIESGEPQEGKLIIDIINEIYDDIGGYI